MDKLRKVYEANGFGFHSFRDQEELREFLLEDIGLEEDITIGGSVTIDSLGIYENLRERGNRVFWHWKEDSHKEVDKNIYFTSTNALTRDGKLVNMDGLGNRVAAMIDGYERVYVIAGINKLTDNYEDASRRIREVAGPRNAQRLKKNTPCVKLNYCVDCNSSDRICRAETIIHKNPMGSKIIVCLVDESLGY